MDAQEIGRDALVEAFEHLDAMRATGQFNMIGSSGLLQDQLAWPRNEARAAATLWMTSYDGDVPAAERAQKVFEAA